MIMHRLSIAQLSWEEENSDEYFYNDKLLEDMDETIEKIEKDIIKRNRGQTRGTRERAPVSDPRGRNRGVCGSCPSFVIIDEDLKE